MNVGSENSKALYVDHFLKPSKNWYWYCYYFCRHYQSSFPCNDNKAIPVTANTAPTDARTEGHSLFINKESGKEYRGPIDSNVNNKAKGI
jgi:hypothetical protein